MSGNRRSKEEKSCTQRDFIVEKSGSKFDLREFYVVGEGYYFYGYITEVQRKFTWASVSFSVVCNRIEEVGYLMPSFQLFEILHVHRFENNT